MAWNFDNPQPIIPWIINNPDTDKATALLIYWLMQPAYFKENYANREEIMKKYPYMADDFDIIEEIEEKYMAGFIKINNLNLIQIKTITNKTI